jgi:hypothetical protein
MSKTQTTQTNEKNSVSVSVSGFKQPIVFTNIQNMKAPYTPQNVAVICYDILMGYPDISKVRMNQFTLKIDCISGSKVMDCNKGQDNTVEAAAWVSVDYDYSKTMSELKKGIMDSATLSVNFDGSLKSMVNFGHELVHVAQYASKRLRQPLVVRNKKLVVKTAFTVNGKVMQKAERENIPYYDRAWEWEAYGSQHDIACSIYQKLTGEIPMDLIAQNVEKSVFMNNMEILQQKLASSKIIGWESFPIKIVHAYGDAKVTGSKRDMDWGC